MADQLINTSDAPKYMSLFKNNEGASLPADAVVAFENVLASCHGRNVVQPNTSGLDNVVGVLDTSAADQASVWVQTWGYRGTSIVYHTGTTLASGVRMIPVAGANYWNTSSGGTAGFGARAVLLQTVNCDSVSGTASAKIALFCM